MRIVSLSVVITALVTFQLLAVPSASADDVPSTAPRPAPKESVPRRWGGARPSAPRLSTGGARGKVLPDAVVEYNLDTNRIAVIRPVDDVKGIPVASSSAKEAAERYLRANHSVLGLSEDLSELHLLKANEMMGTQGFTWEQRYQGIPVFGGEVYVVAKRNAVQLVSANLIPVVGGKKLVAPSDPSPAIRAFIEDVARRYPAERHPSFEPKARLLVLVREGVPIPVWEVDYITTDDTYKALVDAMTNEILSAGSTFARD